jgi:hypothetical protein
VLAAIAMAAFAGVALPASVRAQQVAARFEITAVGDSTFSFWIGDQRWAALRQRGIVVDPARRDALVARFRVLGVHADTVTALVTGQTGPVTTEHFVVMQPPPPPPWYRRRAFWGGAGLGTVVGVLLGVVIS